MIITHPEVSIDPAVPITDWGLSVTGRKRATEFASSEVLSKVTQIWTSGERKARETGEILAAPRTLPVNCHLGLGENDRSATGYLPRDGFEAAADAFLLVRKSAIAVGKQLSRRRYAFIVPSPRLSRSMTPGILQS